MQVRFKFEDYVEEITITVRANELIVGLPEPRKAPRWETEGLVKVEPAPLPYGIPAYGVAGEVEVKQGKTLYEVSEEAGELDDVPVPLPPKQRKPRKRNSGLYRFDEWYAHYPRKTNRGLAEKVWAKMQPDDILIDTMIRAIELQRKSPDFLKDGGAFIPHPSTWLNGKRWLDEIPGTQPTEELPYAHKPWGAFIKENQPHEVLNLMQSVGLDDTEAVLEKWLEDGLEATCDWLWGMRAAQ